MTRTTCSNVHLFHDEELPPEDAQAFAYHLADCASCRRQLRELADIDADVARVRLNCPKESMFWPTAALIVFLIALLAVVVFFSGRT